MSFGGNSENSFFPPLNVFYFNQKLKTSKAIIVENPVQYLYFATATGGIAHIAFMPTFLPSQTNGSLVRRR